VANLELRCVRVLTTKNVNDVEKTNGGLRTNRAATGRTALHWTVFGGNVDCVKFCLEMGANVNVHDKSGRTSLHYATTCKSVLDLNIANVLLDAGALVDAPENNGWTPFYCAICSKREYVARLLIDRGAQISNVILNSYLHAIPD
jgi:ankyrin repeat protein